MRYRHFHYKGTLKTGTLKGILNMEKLFVDLGKKSYDILFSDSFNGLAAYAVRVSNTKWTEKV